MHLLSFNRTTATRTGAAIFERALLGATTFLVTILLGRWGGPDELGLFIIFFPLLFIAIALQESLITAPYTVYIANRDDPADRRAYLGGVLNHTVILCALAAPLMAITALGFNSAYTTRRANSRRSTHGVTGASMAETPAISR